MFEDIKRGKLDIETILPYLDVTINNLKLKINCYQDKRDSLGMLPFFAEKIEKALTCKEFLEFVQNVIVNHIDKQQLQAANIYDYKPKKISSFLEIGKYKREVKILRDAFDTLMWGAKISHKKEDFDIYNECIQKLNFVYNNMASLNKLI